MLTKLILLTAIFIEILLILIVLIKGKFHRSNGEFVLFCISGLIWNILNYLSNISIRPELIMYSYSFGSVTIYLGFRWIASLTKYKISKLENNITLISTILLFNLSLFNGFIIYPDSNISLGANFGNTHGFGLTIYMILFIFISARIIHILVKSISNTENLNRVLGYKYLLLGVISTLSISLVSSFILPHYGIFLFGGIDGLGFLIFLLSILYSTIRHKIIDINIYRIELYYILLWLIIFIRILYIENSSSLKVEIMLFIFTLLFGIKLIHTSIIEMRQREQLRILNETLEMKVKEQTIEIRKSYDLENQSRRELEKLNATKNQFIMITQHNIRNPVTGIMRSLNNLNEVIVKNNAIQMTSDNLKNELLYMKNHADNLKRITDDFLNIATLKTSSQILNLSMTDIIPIIKNVINDLDFDIKCMNIGIKFRNNCDEKVWPKMKIDASKLYEVFVIIVENAIKYNIRNGEIVIDVVKIDDNIQISVINTGIGIDKKEKENIFSRLFYRSKLAKDNNPKGMGIGLSVAKAIIEAHHGEINLISDGINLGATSRILLPIDFINRLERELNNTY